MLIYKSLNSLLPNYLRKLFIKCSDDRGWFLRSSDTDVRIPLLRTINDQKAFSFRGAKLWNSLERKTKSAPSLKNNYRKSYSLNFISTLLFIDFVLYYIANQVY